MKNGHNVLCVFAWLSCLIFLFCMAANAQAPSNPDKNQNIKRLLQVQGGLNDLKKQIDDQVTAYCQNVPGLFPEFAESVKKGINEGDLGALIDKLVSAYDKHFTDEEIAELLKFYQSPVGKKTLNTMPRIMAEQGAIAMEWAQSCAVRITDKLSGLTRAVAAGDTARVKDLLVGGAEVNQRDPQGVTPLMVAAYKGDTPLAKLLVEKGADVNAKSKKGSTPLMAAVQSGNKEMVKFLLDSGADANAKEEMGLNAYQLALMQQKHELTTLLKEKTNDTKPVRPGTVVTSLAKAKGCVPVMERASDSAKKITCLKPGQEVVPIADSAEINGWTLIQYPKLGWVPAESLKQKLVIGEPQKRVAAEPRESVAGESLGAESQPEAESTARQETQGTETAAAPPADQPRIWWRH